MYEKFPCQQSFYVNKVTNVWKVFLRTKLNKYEKFLCDQSCVSMKSFYTEQSYKCMKSFYMNKITYVGKVSMWKKLQMYETFFCEQSYICMKIFLVNKVTNHEKHSETIVYICIYMYI
jgi:hypothetical protein